MGPCLSIHPWELSVPDCGRIFDPAALSPQGITTTTCCFISSGEFGKTRGPSVLFHYRLSHCAFAKIAHRLLQPRSENYIQSCSILAAPGRARRLQSTNLLLACSPPANQRLLGSTLEGASITVVLTQPYHRAPNHAPCSALISLIVPMDLVTCTYRFGPAFCSGVSLMTPFS